jgi:riboflavin kinase / FMN adenylyltransferase
MELIYGLHNLCSRHRGCVATIGAFDGLHRGHDAVLKRLEGYAQQYNLPSTLIVFEPLPREYFAPLKSPARLTSFRERWEQLKSYNIDRVLLLHFTELMSNMSAEEFINRVFIQGLGVRQVIVGDDLRFGHDRKGDFNLLQDMGEQHGFNVAKTPTYLLDDERVSSTRLRRLLEQDQFEQVEHLLGRPYTILGKVVYGRQLGRTLGVPTANLALKRLRSALSGVYITSVLLENGQIKHAVANIGTRPTVDDSLTAILEVHILDFDQDIYGQTLTVSFLKKIREEKQFDSIDSLKKQIHLDIDYAKQYFA